MSVQSQPQRGDYHYHRTKVVGVKDGKGTYHVLKLDFFEGDMSSRLVDKGYSSDYIMMTLMESGEEKAYSDPFEMVADVLEIARDGLTAEFIKWLGHSMEKFEMIDHDEVIRPERMEELKNG